MKYYKTKYSSVEEEIIKFNELLSKNPNKGKIYSKDEFLISGNKTSKYVLFKWITGEDTDRLITSQFLERELNKLGYNIQLYYDIICLGLVSIFDRPRCIICGKTCEFTKIYLGYSKTCSSDCRKSYKSIYTTENGKRSKSKFTREKLRKSHLGKKMSIESREKISKNNIGKHIITKEQRSILISRRKEVGYIVSEETKIKISNSNKGKKHILSEEGRKSLQESLRSRKRIISKETREKISSSLKGKKRNLSKISKQRLIHFNKTRNRSQEESEKKSLEMINRINNGFQPLSHFKKEKYFSDIFKEEFYCDSSWEKKFLILLEQKFISNEINSISRCRVPVIYHKDDGTRHRYLPDFVIEFKSGIKVVIEIKPANLLKTNRVVYLKKIAAMKEFKKQRIKYIILTENELFKNIHGSFNIFDYII